MSKTKVYYYHTSKLLATKHKVVPPCTIAVQKDGDLIKYGIAICSKHDNFSRKTGREISEARLNLNFGHIEVAKIMTKNGQLEDVTDEQLLFKVLWSLVSSIVKKNKKWKSKLTKFNKSFMTKATSVVDVEGDERKF